MVSIFNLKLVKILDCYGLVFKCCFFFLLNKILNIVDCLALGIGCLNLPLQEKHKLYTDYYIRIVNGIQNQVPSDNLKKI